MLIEINQENPDERKIKQIVKCLEDGGIIIYPTDTIYGIGCDIFNAKAVERICQLKGVKPKKVNLSFVCYDLSHLSDYTMQFDKSIYKLMSRNLPGPFTFILKGNNTVPKLFKSSKKTIGVRVPDNNIPRAIVEALGRPILTTSLKNDDEVLEYMTDPELIYEKYYKLVDMVIDGGFGDNEPSTVVDCTKTDWEIIRQGKGELLE